MGNDHIELTAYEAHTDSTVELPLASSGVHAGFPSPAEDFVEGSLDLNRLLIKDSAATFFVRVEGDSMQDAGIYDGQSVGGGQVAPPPGRRHCGLFSGWGVHPQTDPNPGR